jgi:long-chain acyl-CoA synthetase
LGSAGARRDGNDTFAKLLRAHAAERGYRPAFRHKDFGLWGTWTWAEAYAETRAIAAGLLGLGLDRGDTMAVVGTNRPKLYWSITAAQMIGAVPAPLYADSVADEIAAVLDHFEAAVIVAQDQEQVDKILSVRGRLPRLRHLIYDEPRGLVRTMSRAALSARLRLGASRRRGGSASVTASESPKKVLRRSTMRRSSWAAGTRCPVS